MTTDELYPASRLAQVREAVAAAGLDAVLLTPGPDLRYAIGYDAKQLERLTCLAVPAHGDPALFVPRLELAAVRDADAEGVPLAEGEIVGEPGRGRVHRDELVLHVGPHVPASVGWMS